MGSISLAFNRMTKQRPVNIPNEYENELLQEFLDININREKLLSYILIAISIILFLLDIIPMKFYGLDRHIFLHFSIFHYILLMIPSVFLILNYAIKKYMQQNFAFQRVLHILINILVMTICSIVGFLNMLSDQQPFAYTVAIFCIASLIKFKPNERIYIFTFPYIIYVSMIFITQKSIIYELEYTIYFTLLTIIAFVVSCINYNSNIKDFINNRIILEKNNELKSMYSAAQDTLKERTEALNETVEYEKSRTNFFANISHELRTPLTIITSAQQMLDYMLKNTKVENSLYEIHQYMYMIKQNSNRLLRLISNLIDITKIDAGYFHVDLQNHDIVSVVEDITLSVAKYIEDKHKNLIFDTEIEEKIIAFDPDKIERIMLNLLSNAVKFTPEGGTIFVNISDNEENVVISVKDTGIGIPDEMKDLIFEKFVQVDNTSTRGKEGSGIGLSIVKSIVEMHKGSISLISEQGKGSEFIIRIPSRALPNTDNDEQFNPAKCDNYFQKVNIEFSDIDC